MNSLNRFEFIGRLGHDPELKFTQDGNHRIARFNLATSISVTNADGSRDEKTDWHRIVLWDKLADIAQSYLHKGDRVFLSGRVRHHSWTDNTTGEKKFGTEFIATQLVMLSPKDKQTTDAEAYAEASDSDAQPSDQPF